MTDETARLREVLVTIAEHHHEAISDPGWCNFCGQSHPCWTRTTALLGAARSGGYGSTNDKNA